MKAGTSSTRDLTRMAVVSWAGEKIPEGPARDGWFLKQRPKVHALINKAYRKIHSLDDEEEKYFSESMERVKKGNAAAG